MNFNLVNSHQSLSIRMYPDGFSLFVCNENNELVFSSFNIVENTSGEFDAVQLTNSLPSSSTEYHSVTLTPVTDFYSLIPAVLFKPEKAKDLLKLHHPALSDSSEILHTFYKHTESILVYAYDKKTFKAVLSIFPQISIQHHLHQLVEELESINGEHVSILLRAGRIDCLALNKNGIQLLNSFEYQTTEDIVFHVLNILHHLHFNTETTGITIYREEDIRIFPETILKTYVSSINCKEIQTGR